MPNTPILVQANYLEFLPDLKIKSGDKGQIIFDPVRKKYVMLTPEERVRQLLILYLCAHKGYRKSRIAVEKSILVNELPKRFDLMTYDSAHRPMLLAECKAPGVKIDQDTFRQVAWYNYTLQVPFLLVTNGVETFCCSIDFERRDYAFLNDIPPFE